MDQKYCPFFNHSKMLKTWEFLGNLVVRILGFHCHGQGSVPGWGTRPPQAMQCSQKKKKMLKIHPWFTSQNTQGFGLTWPMVKVYIPEVFKIPGLNKYWINNFLPGTTEWYSCLSAILIKSVCWHAKAFQSCPTLCDPKNYSPSGSSVHGVLQARILEWVAMPSSKLIRFNNTKNL